MIGGIWNFDYAYIYLPILSVVTCMLVYRLVQWRRFMRYLGAFQSNNGAMLQGCSLQRYGMRTLLMFIGIIFLLLALLQPQWNKKEHKVYQQGRDIFIALDTSRSMLAADCRPNRLEFAKKKIKELLAQLSCDRIGLIVFSGTAFVQCPLTDDYAAFLLFLDQLDVETISSGTTACDQAIKTALQSFKSLSESKHKLLMLITDGEDFSHDLALVKQEAQRCSLHIVTLGVGTSQGAPIPCFDEHGVSKGHQKDKAGTIVISRLNETMLQAVARDSGGHYLKMSNDDSDIQNIVRILSSYEKNRFDDRTISQYEQQYPWFVAVSLICFVLEWFL